MCFLLQVGFPWHLPPSTAAHLQALLGIVPGPGPLRVPSPWSLLVYIFSFKISLSFLCCHSVNMNLSKLWKIVENGRTWRTTVYVVEKSQTRLSNWTTTRSSFRTPRGRIFLLFLYLLFKTMLPTLVFLGFPCGSAGKESACSVGDLGLIPRLGRSPGEGKGYPLQYSGLENSMNCIVHGVSKSQTRLSNFH